MYAFEIIAERRIQEAMKNGEFDNNPLAGKPLPRDGLENIPEDLRMVYKILKNAGVIPEEMEIKREIGSLQDLIRACEDEDERFRLQHRLNEKQLKFNLLIERRLGREFDPYYRKKIMEKLGR